MLSAQRAKGDPQPTPAPPGENLPSKRDLTSWWKQFKRGTPKREDEKAAPPETVETPGIFGVPLQTSIRYANVAISLYRENGETFIYGYVPIVVAKCGVYLKEKATEVEGIFRLSGSEKRIKELRNAFNSPDRYGKGLDWTGYTVHDAANILRRYFNQLPEPIIPLQFYERFREPLRNHQSQAVGPIEGQSQTHGDFHLDSAIKEYQKLITEIPPLNRQLLLYILDLLAVFASKSEMNKMTTANLAAIFQPGLLSHPSHDMSPREYRLSQDVLIFLIENQDHFLIGMQGTAADEKTLRDVQSGAPAPRSKSPTPSPRESTGLGRSASNASAGADSVRKYGGVRRNRSLSSRNSRGSVTPQSPGTSTFNSNSSGVHRSNTVPSKKSPVMTSNRFSRDRPADPSSPTPASQGAVVSPGPSPLASVETSRLVAPGPPQVISPSSEEPTPIQEKADGQAQPPFESPAASAASEILKPQPHQTGLLVPSKTRNDAEPTTVDSPSSTGDANTGTRSFSNIFARTTSHDVEKREGRKPNKLQKKRAPSSNSPSAHSSTHSLSGRNPSEAPLSPPITASATPTGPGIDHQQSPPFDSTPQKSEPVKDAKSPSTSLKSHDTVTDFSEAEHGDEARIPNDLGSPEKREEKKRRWRIAPKKEGEVSTPKGHDHTHPVMLGSPDKVATSPDNGERGRRSFNAESNSRPSDLSSHSGGLSTEQGNGHTSKESERKGPISWLSRKMHERKDKEAERQRAKSPENKSDSLSSKQSLSQSLPSESNLHRPKPAEPASVPAETIKEGVPLSQPASSQAPKAEEHVQASPPGPSANHVPTSADGAKH